MTKEQEEIVTKELILLDMEDVIKRTKWCKKVVYNMFAHDKEFPAIKKGKKYLVELNALKKYFGERRAD